MSERERRTIEVMLNRGCPMCGRLLDDNAALARGIERKSLELPRQWWKENLRGFICDRLVQRCPDRACGFAFSGHRALAIAEKVIAAMPEPEWAP